MAFRIDEFSEFPSGIGFVAQERARFNTVGFGFPSGIQEEIGVPTQPTGQDAIRQILLALVEFVDFPATSVSSGFWTLDEIVGYLNERQARFLKDTGIRLRRAELDAVGSGLNGMRYDEFAAVADTDVDASDRTRWTSVGFTIPSDDPIRGWALPSDWADTHRVTWRNTPIAPASSLLRIDEFARVADSDIDAFDRARFSLVGFTFPFWYLGLFARRELPRGDSWELDHADRDWQTSSQTFPTLYTEVEEVNKFIEVAPAAADTEGIVEVLYTSVGDELSNAAVNFSVPDEFVPAIKWGVISDMLSKPGRAHDPERSVYAEQRYQEGVVGARLLIRGWA